MKRIGEEGVRYLDLRENIKQSGMDSMALFYRTDHHWTVPASKWAAEIIAEYLNNNLGYSIDLSLYDDNKFNYVEYKNAWLGEQGKKVAKSYIGLDDFTMIEPLYDTDYIITKDGCSEKGGFDLFIKKEIYGEENQWNVYDSPSWHYSYNGYPGGSIHNNNVSGDSILILGDSYEYNMIPFLSLGLENIDFVILRQLNESQSVREIIEAGNYDLVIVSYAQFMIGAHDDKSNANYRMFTFD